MATLNGILDTGKAEGHMMIKAKLLMELYDGRYCKQV